MIDPVKVVITNYPDDQVEQMEMENNPEDPTSGTHTMPFSREIYIERDDFMENPPKKFFRMTPDKEVRLKGAYIVKCTGCKKDADGRIEEIYCEYDPESKSGMPGSMRKVKGTLHWVSARHCIDAEVRLYDRLFAVENASEVKDRDFHELLNPDSIRAVPRRERRAGGTLPVPAHRLLHARQKGLYEGASCVQPHNNAQRQLAENQQIKESLFHFYNHDSGSGWKPLSLF